MQHYHGKIVLGLAELEKEEQHHLLDVRRVNLGEEIEVSDGENVYRCIVASLHPLQIQSLGLAEGKRELDNDITLGFALLKGDHNELIVLKGTEMGLNTFIPIISERCVVRPKEGNDNKITRLQKVASEGAKQCRRSTVPEVKGYTAFKDMLLDDTFDRKYFAYEGEAGKGVPLLEAVQSINKNQRILLLVGPEGGWSEAEARKAKEAGFCFVSLGRRILRAETAALYGAAILSAKSED